MFLVNLQFCNTIWNCGFAVPPAVLYDNCVLRASLLCGNLQLEPPPTWHTQPEHVYFLTKCDWRPLILIGPCALFLFGALSAVCVLWFSTFLVQKNKKNAQIFLAMGSKRVSCIHTMPPAGAESAVSIVWYYFLCSPFGIQANAIILMETKQFLRRRRKIFGFLYIAVP